MCSEQSIIGAPEGLSIGRSGLCHKYVQWLWKASRLCVEHIEASAGFKWSVGCWTEIPVNFCGMENLQCKIVTLQHFLQYTGVEPATIWWFRKVILDQWVGHWEFILSQWVGGWHRGLHTKSKANLSWKHSRVHRTKKGKQRASASFQNFKRAFTCIWLTACPALKEHFSVSQKQIVLLWSNSPSCEICWT